MEEEGGEGNEITVGLSPEKDQPDTALTADGKGTERLLNHVSVAEKTNSGNGVVDVEPLRSNCFLSVIVPGACRRPSALPAGLDSGSGIPLIGERLAAHGGGVTRRSSGVLMLIEAHGDHCRCTKHAAHSAGVPSYGFTPNTIRDGRPQIGRGSPAWQRICAHTWIKDDAGAIGY